MSWFSPAQVKIISNLFWPNYEHILLTLCTERLGLAKGQLGQMNAFALLFLTTGAAVKFRNM